MVGETLARQYQGEGTSSKTTMDRDELKKYINEFNEFSDINSEKYKKVRMALLYLNMYLSDDVDIYWSAKQKGII